MGSNGPDFSPSADSPPSLLSIRPIPPQGKRGQGRGSSKVCWSFYSLWSLMSARTYALHDECMQSNLCTLSQRAQCPFRWIYCVSRNSFLRMSALCPNPQDMNCGLKTISSPMEKTPPSQVSQPEADCAGPSRSMWVSALIWKGGREESLAGSPVTHVSMREDLFSVCPLNTHSNMPQSGSN